MANIKSSAKRDEKSKELRAKNRADKTEKLLLRQLITQPARV